MFENEFSVLVKGKVVKETTVPSVARAVCNKYLSEGVKNVFILSRKREKKREQ